MVNKLKSNKSKAKIHFRKKWHLFVRTWFKQKTQKIRRRKVRCIKTKTSSITPQMSKFRPVVKGQTIKNCRKKRLGRGFTLEEINLAGVKPNLAPSIGLIIDKRRKNRSLDSLDDNVRRIKNFIHLTENTDNNDDIKVTHATPITKQVLNLANLLKSKCHSILRDERMRSRLEGRSS